MIAQQKISLSEFIVYLCHPKDANPIIAAPPAEAPEPGCDSEIAP